MNFYNNNQMFELNEGLSKMEVKSSVLTTLKKMDFKITGSDFERPWGGFFLISESQAPEFIKQFFKELNTLEFDSYLKLSPKILVVAPGKRLSWQYHHRRSEIWKLIGGSAGVVKSKTDDEGTLQKLNEGDIVELERGERHRLAGLDQWGIIAEIWKHTDPAHPSDEDDIVRVQDDFGR